MGTLVEARYDMHPQAKDKLNALILEQKIGATATEEKVERSLDSLLFESSCRFVMRDVSTYRKNDGVWTSDPFYSGPQGYKMCLEVYANGVEEVRGNYCSVFIRLLEGDFDGELLWPCRGSANVILLNLSQSRGHSNNIRKTIEFSFSEPVGGMSPAAVASVFVADTFQPSHQYLQPATGVGLGTVSAFQTHQPPFGASAYLPRGPPAADPPRSRQQPQQARNVGGKRVPGRRAQSRPSGYVWAPRAGIKKFTSLSPGYSPYEINDCSWYEVSVVHIR